SSGGKWQFTKIHEFTPDEGGNLQGGLTLDAAGNLYGSEMAGTSGYGAIFELSHSTAGWQEQTLAAFGGSNGIGPWQTPVFDGHGNLFGTTQRGGAAPYCGSCGVIYKLAPNGDGTWSETVVYNFGSRPNSADGATPIGGLTLGRDGNFYGTAYQGGDASYGVVYQFTP
ncbi:MAG: hypothetical protein JO261_01125, partial [Alphaproteobacteria bacterium]|nr:hypothetical protein [Alphaproteobacteria bacterium]